jgi:hypothetical protein
MRTSPTGAARSVAQPNFREQDYLKKPLLCLTCDGDRFGSREKVFAETVDARFENRTLPASGFPFAEELRYFVASVAWRIIVWGLGEREGEMLTSGDHDKLAAAESALREYLLDEAPYPEKLVPHLIMAPYFTEGAPTRINELMHSSLGATIESNGENLWVIAFMSGYVVVLVVALEEDSFIAWTFNTWLMPGWRIIPGRLTHDKKFWDSIVHFGEQLELARIPLSEKQAANVARRVEAVAPEKLRTNPHVFALYVDYVNRLRQQKGDESQPQREQR